ncbi:hypothetical protein RND81_02G155700 [Saponaria officinalis]|uniref:NADH dehydrogenase subunit 4 n=1 Tax=Saponaria officinalis TaxID=3572 RepID=A0AAW1MUJ0_SAPOF
MWCNYYPLILISAILVCYPPISSSMKTMLNYCLFRLDSLLCFILSVSFIPNFSLFYFFSVFSQKIRVLWF